MQRERDIKTILLVDDSSFARRSTRRVLEEAGYNIEEAADGAQAIERYYIRPPDLVLLDNVMPGLSGIETLEKLRQMDPKACVIMLTSDVQEPTRREARGLGAMGYLNKPLDKEEVLQVIADALRNGRERTTTGR